MRTFFQDPKFVKKVLTTEYKIMTSEQADAFLDATFNITYVCLFDAGTPVYFGHIWPIDATILYD